VFNRLRCTNSSVHPVMLTVRVARFACLASFLLALSFNAFAQNELKEQAAKSDVGAAVRELSRAEQSQSPTAMLSLPAPHPAPSQTLIRIVPFGRIPSKTTNGIKSQAPTGAQLTYFGGPVISNIQVVAVFWGPNVVSTITANGAIDQFYTDITGSRYFDLLTEYTTAGITNSGGVSSNQTIGHGTFGGKFTITPSVCPGPAACTVTDAQIQLELANQINSHVLPAPQTDVHGIVNTYYAVYFPPSITIALDATTHSCVQGGFCAYHSNTGSDIPYGVLPDFSTGGCSVGCGGGTVFQNATAVSSHEMAEAITDAQVGSASVFGPPLAWYDDPPNLGEIADLCDPFDVTVNAGASTYTVEMLFSNVQNRCVSGPPVFSMPSPAGGAGPSIPFSMTLTIRYNDSSIITPLNYLGTVHFTSSDHGAVLPADYTFTAADAGVHTFPFTLTLLGNQTITVTDTHSSGFTGTTTVNVNTTPDLGIDMHHSGNFGRTETGVYTITASNGGGGPTSGTVTVVDTLPIGMTASAMSGSGWTCTLNTLTCTRSDALAPENSYPPITVTVNVSTNTSSQETNIATISGGGETDTANDVVGDVTNIVNPGVALGAAITPFQLFTSQGDTGDTYAISVGNGGSDASSGTVSVTTTLPPSLTATAISGTGWSCTLANLTCTRSDALGSALNYPAITVTFSVALNAPLGFFSISTTVSGGGAPASNTVNTSLEINSFLAIFSGGATVTVNAGQPAQYVLGVATTAAAGTVTFSCSGLPAAASCSFNPPSINSTSVFVTMTVSTTARSAVVTGPHPGNRNLWLWLGVLSLAAMARLSLKISTKPTRLRRLVPIFGTCIFLIAGILAGCGGGGGGTTTTTTLTGLGTPAGTYAITFTATSPNGVATRTMNLIVR
jgi:hypothetical protein